MSQTQATGKDVQTPQVDVLQPGETLLHGQYEILRFLSSGGFGITYLARDSLERQVVIKECFPGALCRRVGSNVEAADPEYAEDLKAIIGLFIQEARNHARLVHPNIVNVHQVFEYNQTAYLAMDLIRGGDLLDYVRDTRNDITPEFFVKVTEKMLSAVSFIHDNGMLHRDISPDNILIDEDDEPLLIDFGAARELTTGSSGALMTLRVVKDGYSPHEFYARGAEQDVTSDLYVLAATLYHAISGERPVDGKSRLDAFNSGTDDPYVPLAGRFDGYPAGFLEALDKAMEVHIVNRVQSALEWLRMFRGPDVQFEEFSGKPSSVIVALDRTEGKPANEQAEAIVTALLTGDEDVATTARSEGLTQTAPKNDSSVTVVTSGSGGGSKAVVFGALALVAVGAVGFFMMGGSEDATPAQDAQTTTVPPVSAPEPDTKVAATTSAPALDPVTSTALPEATSPAPQPTADASRADEMAAQATIDLTPTAPVEPVVEPEAVLAQAEDVVPASQDVAVSDGTTDVASTPKEPAAAEPVAPVVVEPEPVPEPAPEPLIMAAEQVEEIFGVRTANVVEFPVLPNLSDPNAVLFAGGAFGDQVKPGQRITSVNGVAVKTLTEIPQIISETAAYAAGDQVTATFAFESDVGVVSSKDITLPALKETSLPNGLRFHTQLQNDAWVTTVVDGTNTGKTGLLPGDRLVALMPGNEAIETETAMAEILRREIENGTTKYNFAVNRNDSLWFVSMTYAPETAN
ncbi:protein kinase domain-containing protein [Aliiroseovarius marinus]|uniref:protein kinase domain-containing protein n=1 Tax=Aliiroseovarius marinus TaxID=2500159 RepID=UPI002491D630|nr:protein kinase [Aliiroseovarius marinus]